MVPDPAGPEVRPASTAAEPDPVAITPCPDGPLLVRGPFQVQGEDGVALDAGRSTIALCRCGFSGSKPFCDGSHKAAGWRS